MDYPKIIQIKSYVTLIIIYNLDGLNDDRLHCRISNCFCEASTKVSALEEGITGHGKKLDATLFNISCVFKQL